MKRIVVLLLLICAQVSFLWAAGSEHTPTPAAKAAFEKARTIAISDWKEAAAAYLKAIRLDPDYYEAHANYIQTCRSGPYFSGQGTEAKKKAASEKELDKLEAQYNKWAKEHPDKPVYQWALGELNDYSNPELAVSYYNKALKLDPNYAPAWDMLGAAADEYGDLALSREHEQKAHESWPNSVTFWRHYLGSWVNIDPTKAEQITLQMIEKYPDDGVLMLGYLAMRSRSPEHAREIYELILKKYLKYANVYLTMPLFNMYLESNPVRALALAQQMAKNNPKDNNWPLLVNYAQTIVDAKSQIAAGKSADVVAALDKVKLPAYGVDHDALEITRAQALSAEGQPAKAYSGLVAVFVKTPSDNLHAALLEFGEKLNKSAAQVDADVWAQLSANAKPGIPFSVTNLRTGKPVSLADYKGKVFLLNFFYPKCGPCRGEFPFLQSVLDKYKSQGFDILAINGHPPEKSWVLPLMKGYGLGFLPLDGDDQVVSAYKVRGFPSNFLYGADGRIYYTPPPVSTLDAEKALEWQIRALLREAKKNESQKGSAASHGHPRPSGERPAYAHDES